MSRPLLGVVLQPVDWVFILGFFAVALVIGVLVARRAGRNASEFFLSGRSMPWWLLGFSMVATTFSTDTPNLVTDLVRNRGVAGNWVWWAFLLTGMLTVFIYAKLWRRSGVTTDIEFYELRYSGKPAAFLRGFRAVYLGLCFNVLIMATVTVAAIKIGGVMLGFTPVQTILVASVVTVVFSAAGGLRGVLLTDFLLFIVAMLGAITAAYVAVGHEAVGGLSGLLQHENLAGKLSFFPDPNNTDMVVTLLVLPLAVQWWSAWYPGSEPGGGGYIAQRMLAAKDERHAVGATLFFNAAHYALRPWPWIIVALASLIVFPTLEDIKTAFPNLPENVPLQHDLAYPAMLTFIPAGWLGLVVASLVAAYMSTISTHLNWGSSYLVNDVWTRFINPRASEREKVLLGRILTVFMMACAALLALTLEHAAEAFQFLVMFGAGTGLIYILRWFWWRINAFSELTAMIVSFPIALFFHLQPKIAPQWQLAVWQPMLIIVGVTTLAWVAVTYLTPPASDQKLRAFYRSVKPGGPGWAVVVARARAEGDMIDEGDAGWSVPLGIVCMVAGCVAVYSTLFATGQWIYGNYVWATALSGLAAAGAVLLVVMWRRLTRLDSRDPYIP
jgi:solute:Na+ symporter, SSS family